jgi:hypothetical protein
LTPIEIGPRHYRRALAVFRAAGDPVGASQGANSLAFVEFRLGRAVRH